MRIGVVEVFVDDQDEARRFYTELLRLRLKDDAPYDDSWPLADCGVPRGPRWHRAAARPALALVMSDCRQTYCELVDRGVAFLSEPQQTPYGIHAVLDDSCGNLISLHQE
jgi:predicted enzyme related to lactoylglutathione lyase